MDIEKQTTEIIMGLLVEYDEMSDNKTKPSAVRVTAERIMSLIKRQGYKATE